MKIGITGSISSGKSTVVKLLSKNSKLIFSADHEVQKLYKNNLFKKKLSKRFKLKEQNLKFEIKRKLLSKKISLKSLGSFIHPEVRKKMYFFHKKNKSRKILFFEIPLLIESKLNKFFDYIIIVISPKKLRLKRYVENGGDKKMFLLLDKSQIPAKKKIKYCNYVIVNNKSKVVLKKKVNDIIRK